MIDYLIFDPKTLFKVYFKNNVVLLFHVNLKIVDEIRLI